ncbi:MAG: hypothetical protein ACP5JH_02060 [Bacteroidota bacterium]
MRAYLSGGMEHAPNHGASWRKELEEWIRSHLGHEVFNPNVESERYFAALGIDDEYFRKLKFEDIDRYKAIASGLVELDMNEIAHRTDYLICLWDESAQRGAGTKGELSIAKFFGKPVFMVMAHRAPLNEIPGWVLGCTTRIFRSFDELKEFLLTLEGGA